MGKKKPSAASPALAGVKRKKLEALVADKSQPKFLRKAARAELELRALTGDIKAERWVETNGGLTPDRAEVRNFAGETVVSGVPDERPEPIAERHPHQQHLDRVGELLAIVGDEGAKKKARKAAQAELDALRAEGEKLNAERDAQAQADAEGDESDATVEPLPAPVVDIDDQIRARLTAKKDRRALLESDEYRAGVDRADAEAVKAYNDELASLGGSRFLTSDAEREKVAAMAASLGKPEPTTAAPAPAPEPEPQPEPEPEPQAAEATPSIAEPQAAEVALRKPSEAPQVDFDTNGLGQYKVRLPDSDKIIGYTRVTTYIDALEDKSLLTKWKMRVLLEGVALTDADEASDEPVTIRVRELVHRRDVTLAKARKADRKGKLRPGELAELTEAAWKDFKSAMDALADEVFELGGGLEAATKGTDIHALCDLYDREGMAAVEAKLDAGEITPSDLEDVRAYAAACERLGLKVTASELPVVNDELRVAGRLDRVFLAKLPEIRDPKTGEVIKPADTRAKRYVGDIKTGNVEFGPGKIAQQLDMYQKGTPYDLDTHERLASHGANPQWGLLLHVPAGKAECRVHLVDLKLGAKGNALAAQVRAFRNDGKRAYSTKLDVAAIVDEGGES